MTTKKISIATMVTILVDIYDVLLIYVILLRSLRPVLIKEWSFISSEIHFESPQIFIVLVCII